MKNSIKYYITIFFLILCLPYSIGIYLKYNTHTYIENIINTQYQSNKYKITVDDFKLGWFSSSFDLNIITPDNNLVIKSNIYHGPIIIDHNNIINSKIGLFLLSCDFNQDFTIKGWKIGNKIGQIDFIKRFYKEITIESKIPILKLVNKNIKVSLEEIDINGLINNINVHIKNILYIYDNYNINFINNNIFIQSIPSYSEFLRIILYSQDMTYNKKKFLSNRLNSVYTIIMLEENKDSELINIKIDSNVRINQKEVDRISCDLMLKNIRISFLDSLIRDPYTSISNFSLLNNLQVELTNLSIYLRKYNGIKFYGNIGLNDSIKNPLDITSLSFLNLTVSSSPEYLKHILFKYIISKQNSANKWSKPILSFIISENKQNESVEDILKSWNEMGILTYSSHNYNFKLSLLDQELYINDKLFGKY